MLASFHVEVRVGDLGLLEKLLHSLGKKNNSNASTITSFTVQESSRFCAKEEGSSNVRKW